MTYLAAIGPMEFQFRGAGVAPVPPVRGTFVLHMEGAELAATDEDGELYLLLDHRTGPRVPLPAYVEFWQPASPAEARLRGLLVLSEPHHQAAIIEPPATLSELAARLQQ